MNLLKPEAIIFDMDGLMLDTEAVAFKSYNKVHEVLGIEIPTFLRHQTIGRPMSVIPDILRAGLPKGTDIDQVLKVCDDHYHHCLEFGELSLKPGLLELLDFLEAQETPKAVATSARTFSTEIKMKRTGLNNYFKEVVTAEQVKEAKPAPDLFLEAARRLGVDASYCLVLEDSKPGVMGAVAAGMQVINVPDVIPADDDVRAGANLICDNLFVVLDLLRNLKSEI